MTFEYEDRDKKEATKRAQRRKTRDRIYYYSTCLYEAMSFQCNKQSQQEGYTDKPALICLNSIRDDKRVECGLHTSLFFPLLLDERFLGDVSTGAKTYIEAVADSTGHFQTKLKELRKKICATAK